MTGMTLVERALAFLTKHNGWKGALDYVEQLEATRPARQKDLPPEQQMSDEAFNEGLTKLTAAPTPAAVTPEMWKALGKAEAAIEYAQIRRQERAARLGLTTPAAVGQGEYTYDKEAPPPGLIKDEWAIYAPDGLRICNVSSEAEAKALLPHLYTHPAAVREAGAELANRVEGVAAFLIGYGDTAELAAARLRDALRSYDAATLSPAAVGQGEAVAVAEQVMRYWNFAQSLLVWNRRQPKPPIHLGQEYVVAAFMTDERPAAAREVDAEVTAEQVKAWADKYDIVGNDLVTAYKAARDGVEGGV